MLPTMPTQAMKNPSNNQSNDNDSTPHKNTYIVGQQLVSPQIHSHSLPMEETIPSMISAFGNQFGPMTSAQKQPRVSREQRRNKNESIDGSSCSEQLNPNNGGTLTNLVDIIGNGANLERLNLQEKKPTGRFGYEDNKHDGGKHSGLAGHHHVQESNYHAARYPKIDTQQIFSPDSTGPVKQPVSNQKHTRSRRGRTERSNSNQKISGNGEASPVTGNCRSPLSPEQDQTLRNFIKQLTPNMPEECKQIGGGSTKNNRKDPYQHSRERENDNSRIEVFSQKAQLISMPDIIDTDLNDQPRNSPIKLKKTEQDKRSPMKHYLGSGDLEIAPARSPWVNDMERQGSGAKSLPKLGFDKDQYKSSQTIPTARAQYQEGLFREDAKSKSSYTQHYSGKQKEADQLSSSGKSQFYDPHDKKFREAEARVKESLSNGRATLKQIDYRLIYKLQHEAARLIQRRFRYWRQTNC